MLQREIVLFVEISAFGRLLHPTEIWQGSYRWFNGPICNSFFRYVYCSGSQPFLMHSSLCSFWKYIFLPCSDS